MKQKLFTAGYEGETIDSFLAKLLQAEINLVLDVRFNAVSRKKGFSKNHLQHACEKIGIVYAHLPDLGIPSSLRKSLRNSEDYRRLFTWYAECLRKGLPACDQAEKLVQLHRTVLLCFEHDINRCHRSKLADVIARRTGMAIVHL